MSRFADRFLEEGRVTRYFVNRKLRKIASKVTGIKPKNVRFAHNVGKEYGKDILSAGKETANKAINTYRAEKAAERSHELKKKGMNAAGAGLAGLGVGAGYVAAKHLLKNRNNPCEGLNGAALARCHARHGE